MSTHPNLTLLKAIVARDESAVASTLESASVDVNAAHEGKLPLVVAIRVGGSRIVERLLSHGAAVNVKDGRGITPLIQAAESLNPEYVRRLLSLGADPNLSEKNKVPLVEAARRRSAQSTEIATMLLHAGADANFVLHTLKGEPSATTLMVASEAANAEVVELLLDAGARVNEVLALGTALTQAVEGGDVGTVRALLNAGADASLRVPAASFDKAIAGKTALEIARAKNRSALVAILSEAAGHVVPAESVNAGNVTDAWRRIVAKLDSDVIATFRAPATPPELCTLERTIGNALPPALVELLSILNGQERAPAAAFIGTDDVLDGEFRLLTTDEIAREWNVWKSLLDKGEFPKASRSKDSGGDRNAWFDANWIPISSNGAGDHHCIDLTTRPDGRSGQIILLRHDDACRTQIAEGLAQWLSHVADQI